LNISVNKFGVAGAEQLAKALNSNKSLKELDVGCNPIGSSGAINFAAALKRNRTLLTLDLSTTELDNGCAAALEDAMAHNSTLTDLGLMCNDNFDIEAMETIFEKFRKNREVYEARLAQQAQTSPSQVPWLKVGGTVLLVVAALAVALSAAKRRK
jgi:Ran GTPase-activating protein (RanGAP) involved in mRNA processing and transport